MTFTPLRALGATALVAGAALVLAGCVAKTDVAASDALDVTSTDTDCAVSPGHAGL